VERRSSRIPGEEGTFMCWMGHDQDRKCWKDLGVERVRMPFDVRTDGRGFHPINNADQPSLRSFQELRLIRKGQSKRGVLEGKVAPSADLATRAALFASAKVVDGTLAEEKPSAYLKGQTH